MVIEVIYRGSDLQCTEDNRSGVMMQFSRIIAHVLGGDLEELSSFHIGRNADDVGHGVCYARYVAEAFSLVQFRLLCVAVG